DRDVLFRDGEQPERTSDEERRHTLGEGSPAWRREHEGPAESAVVNLNRDAVDRALTEMHRGNVTGQQLANHGITGIENLRPDAEETTVQPHGATLPVEHLRLPGRNCVAPNEVHCEVFFQESSVVSRGSAEEMF